MTDLSRIKNEVVIVDGPDIGEQRNYRLVVEAVGELHMDCHPRAPHLPRVIYIRTIPYISGHENLCKGECVKTRLRGPKWLGSVPKYAPT
ncbi:hypothetical protein GCM10022404_29160 [Celeribacter arenosi]|uniref:Uncharacterized protein n=1 Tax=Celeribacter arenosi TaxID=792649 RepID=A0ABP7KHR1_9RHOB